MNDNFIINIGRQLGSGGRQIGRLLAERLNIAFYDRELITLASKQSGLAREVFEDADEKKLFTLASGFLGVRTSVPNESFSGNYHWSEMLFQIQSDVIRDLARRTSCIFVGRCADYILRDHPRTLNVFISAGQADRIKRVTDYYEVSERKAHEIIAKADKKRAGYYNYYSNKEWGVAESYHLCVNSSVLGIEETAGFIEDFLKRKLSAQ
jgi:cytidylate kinase